jgi:hypothetical protein
MADEREDGRARIRVNLVQRELEVEGSEAFVARYGERFEALLDALTASAPAPGPAPAGAPVESRPPVEALGSFGAFVQHLPRGATDVDRILAAAYYAQAQSGDNAFATADANRLLADQGIRIGNPSQCVKQNLLARRVFTLQRGRYRVSQQGVQQLGQLTGLQLGD